MPIPALDQLRSAFAAAATSSGPARLVVRLDPAELGRIQVGITRPPDGPARVDLLAERPETLQLLMRDQVALHRALDLAGVPAAGRTLHFQLAAPDAGQDPAAAPMLQPRLPDQPGQQVAQAHPASGTGAGAGAGMGGHPHGGHSGGRGQPQGWGGPPGQPGRDAGPRIASDPRRGFASRTGVDITA